VAKFCKLQKDLILVPGQSVCRLRSYFVHIYWQNKNHYSACSSTESCCGSFSASFQNVTSVAVFHLEISCLQYFLLASFGI